MHKADKPEPAIVPYTGMNPRVWGNDGALLCYYQPGQCRTRSSRVIPSVTPVSWMLFPEFPLDIPRRIAEPATDEAVHRMHTPHYTAWLRQRSLVASGPGYISDADTYVTRGSFPAACYAAVPRSWPSTAPSTVSTRLPLSRPPGHHAEHDRAMGFCLLNNAAIAAAHALDTVDRVAIIDWDVHHGNGTEHAFYGTDRVLYCSVHQEHHIPL